MSHHSTWMMSAAAGLSLTAALLLAPTAAQACGGFFCSQVPIDQTGEQILFAKRGESIEAHVNIQYQGSAEEFAWIVPTPTRPEVGLSSASLFQQLEWRSGVQFRLDWMGGDQCYWQAFPESAFDDADGDPNAGGGVTVVEQSSIGAYEFTVLQATDTAELFDWLNTNNYDIPENVTPYIDPYVQAGGEIHFVAFRLQSDRDTGDLTPVRLKYTSEKPMVPIQLTAIATEPDLGVTVNVLGDARAVPENYLHVHLNEARINWLQNGSNYDEVVSLAMDEAGGQGFHTEYAGPSEVMNDTLFQEGWYDTDRLSQIDDPVAFVAEMMSQAFRGNPQLMAMFMRYIPYPAELAQQGVDAQQFYNNLEEYRAYIDAELFDPQAFAAELEENVVEPLRHAQELFTAIPYLTRMYTTLSAEEMSRDPVFAFNDTMPTVSNIRRAIATAECENTNNPQDVVVTITLNNGREIVTTIDENWGLVLDDSEPAAAIIEETAGSGSPTVIYDTVKGINDLNAVLDARQRENHEARPDMVPAPTISGDANGTNSDDSGCSVTPSTPTPIGALVLLAFGLLAIRRR